MKIFLRLLALVILLGVGYWTWNFLFPNPQKVIRQRLDKVAKLASFAANQGNVSRAINVQKLGIYFADDIHVAVDIPGVESFVFNHREELMQAAMAARGGAKSVEAKFYEVHVAIEPDNQSAVADLMAVANVAGEKEPYVQKLKFTFKKINGAWLITRVEALPMPGQ